MVSRLPPATQTVTTCAQFYAEGKLAQVRLEEDDSIVLQVQEDSPLLTPAPEDLFDDLPGDGGENGGEDGGASSSFTPTRSGPSMRWKGMLRKGSKLSASMGDIVSMAMGSNMNENDDDDDDDDDGGGGGGAVNKGDSTTMTMGSDGGEGGGGLGGGGVSLKGVSFRSRPTGGVKGVMRESTSLGEISVDIPEDNGTKQPGGESSKSGGDSIGEASAMGAATDGGSGGDGDGTAYASSTDGAQRRENKNSRVDLGGISIRSERPERPDPESIEKARRVRMAHRDLEVTGATAGAAGSDEAGTHETRVHSHSHSYSHSCSRHIQNPNLSVSFHLLSPPLTV